MSNQPEIFDASAARPIPTTARPAVVVCLEEDVYSPVSYLRIVRHLQDLTSGYRISIHVLPGGLAEALALIPQAALLIMARSRHVSSAQAARKAAECQVPILYDVDDYVWAFPDYSKVDRHNTLHTDEIIALAACVTTPSEPLARLIREKNPGKQVRHIANPGNVCNDSATTFTTGVMANSDFFRMPEMKSDFFRALRDAAREAGRPLLLYYFSNDPPEHFTDDPHLRVVWMGFRSYSSYKQMLEYLRPEFGFVLLRDEIFSRHKSVVKFAEYGFAGAIGIYSRVEPYLGFIQDGHSGLLADNTYAGWKEATGRALRLPPDSRRRMQTHIIRLVKQQFDYSLIHDQFRAVLEELTDGKPVSTSGLENIPEYHPFTFRNAYDYAAWVMHSEQPRLEQALAAARTPWWRRWQPRMSQRLAQGMAAFRRKRRSQ